jgi:hypothetical protein
MTPATKQALAIGITAFTAITVGVLYGTRTVERTPDTGNPRRFVVQWPDGGAPEGRILCVATTALVSDQAINAGPYQGQPIPNGGYVNDGGNLILPSALATYGARTDAGPQYVYVTQLCNVVPEDGGPSEDEPLPALPPGMVALEFAQYQWEYDGGPQLSAVLTGEPEWPCACARVDIDAGCEWETMDWVTWEPKWEAAPLATTLTTFRGPGCYGKSCNELDVEGALTSWPTAECGPQ